MLRYLPIVLPLLLGLLGVVAGLLMMGLGWRGRKINERSFCAKCDFDLSDTPEDVVKCPKCGANLTGKWSVVIGERATIQWLVTLGLVVMLASAGVGGWKGWSLTRDPRTTRFKPAWMLLSDLDSTNPKVADSATNELTVRIDLGRLSDSQVAALAERGLAKQADRSGAWDMRWGQLVESGRDRGAVTDEQWKRYVDQSLAISLRIRPTVRLGDAAPVMLEWNGARVGGALPLRHQVTLKQVKVGIATASTNAAGAEGKLDADAVGWVLAMLEPGQLAAAKAGEKLPVEAVATLKVWRDKSAPSAVVVERVLRGELEVVDRQGGALTVLQDPALRLPVRRAVLPQQLLVTAMRDGKPTVQAEGLMTDAGVNLAFDVLLQIDAQRWPLGSLVLRKGVSGSWELPATVIDAPVPGKAQLVLSPSESASRRTVDVTHLWPEEIVLNNVPVVVMPGVKTTP